MVRAGCVPPARAPELCSLWLHQPDVPRHDASASIARVGSRRRALDPPSGGVRPNDTPRAEEMTVRESAVRRLLVISALLVAVLGLAASASAATLPSTYQWATTFSSASDGAGFSQPAGSTYGGCRREVSGGAAWYTWTSSGSDNTRCYPNQTWDPDRFNGIVHTGRYWVDVAPSEIGNSEFFSLATFKMVVGHDWNRVVTLNLKVDTSGPTAGKARLLLWHVPYQGQGIQTRVRTVAFPTRTWVDLAVKISSTGAIEVLQDGQVVLTASKKDAGGGWVSGAHWGGYASPGVRGWKIGNDDLRVRTFGATTTAPPPPPSGGGSSGTAAKAVSPVVDRYRGELRLWFTSLVAGAVVSVDGAAKTVANNGVTAALRLPGTYTVMVAPPASRASTHRAVAWSVKVSSTGTATTTSVAP